MPCGMHERIERCMEVVKPEGKKPFGRIRLN
jgi:hypothetical protein